MNGIMCKKNEKTKSLWILIISNDILFFSAVTLVLVATHNPHTLTISIITNILQVLDSEV